MTVSYHEEYVAAMDAIVKENVSMIVARIVHQSGISSGSVRIKKEQGAFLQTEPNVSWKVTSDGKIYVCTFNPETKLQSP